MYMQRQIWPVMALKILLHATLSCSSRPKGSPLGPRARAAYARHRTCCTHHRTMAGANACVLLAGVVLGLAMTGVSALNGTKHSPNVTLPETAVGHFDPAKYDLPLPSSVSLASAESDVANVTISHGNMSIASPAPTANHWDLQQNPKYTLPIPNKNATAPSGRGEHARVESAAPSPPVSGFKNQSRASAHIEGVPGFVKTQGQQFMLNGRAAYFAGTNAW